MSGWRARIGCIRPMHRKTANTPEWEKAIPEGVLMEYAFLDGPHTLSPENLLGVYPQIEPAARVLGQAGIDVVIQRGTPVCTIHGPGADKKFIEVMQNAAGVPATTCASSMVKAMRRLEIERAVVVTPYYPKEIAETVQRFLEGEGFRVLSLVSVEGVPVTRILDVPQQQTYQLAKRAMMETPEAQGLVLAGAMPTSQIVETLETDLKKPVVALEFAALWDVLNMASVRQPIKGFGRLLTMF